MGAWISLVQKINYLFLDNYFCALTFSKPLKSILKEERRGEQK